MRRLTQCKEKIRAGALAHAASCAALSNARWPASPVMAFGTSAHACLFAGARRSIALRRGDVGDLWKEVRNFTTKSGYVVGYIGFDAAWPDELWGLREPRAASPDPVIELWEPEEVRHCSFGDRLSIDVSLELLDRMASSREPREDVEIQRRNRLEARMRGVVARTIAQLREGQFDRLTVASRVQLPVNENLLSVLLSPPTTESQDVTRSFYLRTAALEMVGHSPELLASGDARRFVCNKLSGTGKRGGNAASDRRLRRLLLSDEKITREHLLSIQGMTQALEVLGPVSSGRRQTLDRFSLRHVLTPLTVDVDGVRDWADVLRAVLPSGAQPRDAALRWLDRCEPHSRGAYYGLVGFRDPDGRFEISQVLRSIFRNHSGVHTFVGAAITAESTVEGELEEMRLKLRDTLEQR